MEVRCAPPPPSPLPHPITPRRASVYTENLNLWNENINRILCAKYCMRRWDIHTLTAVGDVAGCRLPLMCTFKRMKIREHCDHCWKIFAAFWIIQELHVRALHTYCCQAKILLPGNLLSIFRMRTAHYRIVNTASTEQTTIHHIMCTPDDRTKHVARSRVPRHTVRYLGAYKQTNLPTKTERTASRNQIN